MHASLVVFLLLTACSDQTPEKDGASGLDLPDFSGILTCVNAVATDDHCPSQCFKQRGVGPSYCADTCTRDFDCSGKSHAWIPAGVSLVCHPQQGYCTRRCMDNTDCVIGKYTVLKCDPTLQVCVSCPGAC